MGLPMEETQDLAWKLGVSSALMVVISYPGEIQDNNSARWVFSAMSMCPFAFVVQTHNCGWLGSWRGAFTPETRTPAPCTPARVRPRRVRPRRVRPRHVCPRHVRPQTMCARAMYARKPCTPAPCTPACNDLHYGLGFKSGEWQTFYNGVH